MYENLSAAEKREVLENLDQINKLIISIQESNEDEKTQYTIVQFCEYIVHCETLLLYDPSARNNIKEKLNEYGNWIVKPNLDYKLHTRFFMAWVAFHENIRWLQKDPRYVK